ncbi:MAG TPA: DUF3109 family protein [Bacteroidia bacterium]|nr:DUF3109 family protein [Bacteroidia bacterium]HNT80961.1 DUF3109 family protein [Bacteroidia bacterium]
MIIIDNVVVYEDLFKKEFVCNLKKCKGSCCIEGQSGAPLEPKEIEQIQEGLDQILPFLTKEGKKAVKEKGTFMRDADGDLVTTLIGDDGPCAYVNYTPDGTAVCGIENAWEEGKVEFRKPISCHLYPIRIEHKSPYELLRYHVWEICSDACKLGKELSVPVYRFLKDALVRKYGAAWYKKLEHEADQKEKARLKK